MWAMIVKEFRQLRRDRRTLAMMIFLPILLLIIFGYAASFDVKTIPTTVVGPLARPVAAELRAAVPGRAGRAGRRPQRRGRGAARRAHARSRSSRAPAA